MSVIVVSSPPCEKVNSNARRFQTTFDDLRAHEGLSILIGLIPHHKADSSGDLGLMVIGLFIFVNGRAGFDVHLELYSKTGSGMDMDMDLGKWSYGLI